MINVTINGILTTVPKNITVLQACNIIDINIPKFCFQNNLEIAGNCRMCLVEIKNSPKPVASCAMPIAPNMEIFTNTPLVQKARESVLEFILLNHPLDCPICDQASECDLQDLTMVYGSDKSRFFFNKRGVENKNVGPFIKTIMSRCIHCTRCVRFANDICGSDNFGTTGRGTHTEINFYNSNIFYSEFSGNLIDLCPVGALTSKPFSFKARSWELKKKESIDTIDAIGSNINVDVFNNEIVRILPKTNVQINKEWISNKTRFFFDSIKYQRITNPLLKNKENGTFNVINWNQAFNILNKELLNKDGQNIQAKIGNLTDIESIYNFKKNMNQLGISNFYYNNFKNINLNTDLTSNYLFNQTFKSLENTDLCLILNSDIRKEGSILNIHLMNRLKKGKLTVASIGPKINYTYPVQHLGSSIKTLINIIQGKHSFCKLLKKAKNPSIIIGNEFINQGNNIFLLNKLKNLNFLNKNQINILHTESSFLNFLEIQSSKKIRKNKKINLYYLYNTINQIKEKNEKAFIIYQGHHFTSDANHADLILPGLTSMEKRGLYINTFGLIQKTKRILNTKSYNQRIDSDIFKYIYMYIQTKNKTVWNMEFFIDNLSYLKKNKLKNIFINSYSQNTFKINLNLIQKNNVKSTIFEIFSNTLLNAYSKNFSQKKTNYKL